jgi:outer membrane protein TolC
VTEKLVNTVKRRVDLGDLPRADYLLAKSEMLNKRSELVTAEAEQMHARKRFATLTQSNRIPQDFVEQKTKVSEVSTTHPALSAFNSVIARKKAELVWVKAGGSGQTVFSIGGKTERGSRQDENIDSMTFNLSIPFGGGAHLAPEIASAHLQLTEAMNKRDHLYRQLLEKLHETKHALEVGREELSIANELKTIAETHFKMTQLSFEAGEINLMDLLKIQSRSQQAIRHANEQSIMLQRNIAFYNQAAGVAP